MSISLAGTYWNSNQKGAGDYIDKGGGKKKQGFTRKGGTKKTPGKGKRGSTP